MEEKILIKGIFGGEFFRNLLWALSITVFLLFLFLGVVEDDDFFVGMLAAFPFIILAIIASFALAKRELIITNKRVIARAAFGFRTDLPIEKITSVTTRWLGGIGCGSSSMKVMFHFCKNKQEIFDTIASETLKRDSAFLG